MRPIRLKLQPLAASATAIAASASPGAGAITLTALATTGPIDPQTGSSWAERVGLGRIISLVSGGNDSGITFTITGYNEDNILITEDVTGGNATTVVSTKYYTRVTSITHTGSVTTTFSAGVVGTTASAKLGMLALDFYNRVAPAIAVTVSGTISYTVQQTFDDVIGGFTTLANAALFATQGGLTGSLEAGCTALTAQSASKYTRILPGATGLSVTIPTYTSPGFIILSVISPSNSNSN